MRQRVVRAWQRVPPRAVDAALATFFVLLTQVELHTHGDDGYRAGPLLLNAPLEVLINLTLLLRTARPRLALLGMCAFIALPSLVAAHTLFFWGNFLPLMILVYAAARHDDTWVGRWAWLPALLAVIVAGARVDALEGVGDVFFPIVMLVGPWVAGRLTRTLSTQRQQLAEALDQVQGEQARREEAAVDAERRRLAAEMHDVVAHAVSLMTVQVGAARMRLESAGADVPHQLRAAEDTGREALSELRRTLGVMRSARTVGALQPVPRLDSLPELLHRFRDAGLEIKLSGTVGGPWPASMQLAVYRIVQESLTNVLRHAGRVRVSVRLDHTADALDVQVVSAAGNVHQEVPGGHGLAGMRERVGMFGGRLEAGPTPDGGYRVSASLPVPGPLPAVAATTPTPA